MRIQEEITEWEGITHVGGNYTCGRELQSVAWRNSKWEEIPESGANAQNTTRGCAHGKHAEKPSSIANMTQRDWQRSD